MFWKKSRDQPVWALSISPCPFPPETPVGFTGRHSSLSHPNLHPTWESAAGGPRKPWPLTTENWTGWAPTQDRGAILLDVSTSSCLWLPCAPPRGVHEANLQEGGGRNRLLGPATSSGATACPFPSPGGTVTVRTRAVPLALSICWWHRESWAAWPTGNAQGVGARAQRPTSGLWAVSSRQHYLARRPVH